MKPILIILLILILPSVHFGQCVDEPTSPCCNTQITIDPLNLSNTLNNERLNLPTNQQIDFSKLDINWLDVNNQPFKVYSSLSNLNRLINNPILSNNSEYRMITNYNAISNPSIENNPMHPKYGWQLMHAYNGYRPFTSSQSSPVFMNTLNLSSTGYHYMFYNRYTGVTRFLVSPETPKDYQKNQVSVNLGFFDRVHNRVSGIFAYYNSKIPALDKISVVTSAKGIIGGNQNFDPSGMAYTDMRLWYDPCVCQKDLANIDELQIEVRKRNSFDFYAEGKYAGITKQFDKSGNVPSSFGADWLASVWGEYNLNSDFEVKDGFQIYRKADSLAKQFYVSPEMQFLGTMLGMFEKIGDKIPKIKIGTYSMMQLAGFIGDLPPTISAQATNQWQKVDKSKYEIPIGQVLGFGAKKLSSSLNPEVPNVFFSEGQIALRGKMTQDLETGDFTKRWLAHPGSKAAQNTTFEKYPYYNEAPGIFTLLETPEISFSIDKRFKNFTSSSGQLTGFSQSIYFNTKIEKPIIYALNPSANIDIDNSQIGAIIEFDYYLPRCSDEVNHSIDFPVLNTFIGSKGVYYSLRNDTIINKIFPNTTYKIASKKVVSKQKVQTVLGFDFGFVNGYSTICDSIDHFVIQSNIVSIDEIHKYNFFNRLTIGKSMSLSNNYTLDERISRAGYVKWITHTNMDDNFKLNMDRVFDFRLKLVSRFAYKKDNFYNFKPEDLIDVYTMGVETSGKSLSGGTFIAVPDTIKLSDYMKKFNSASSIPNPLIILARTIIKDVDLSLYNTKFILNALSSIQSKPGIPSSSINVLEEIVEDPANPLGLNNEATPEYIKQFCSNNKYKAFVPLKSSPSRRIISNLPITSSYILSLHPNPASSVAKLTLTNYQNSNVNVKIFDLMGREMLEVIEKDITSREHSVDLDIERLAPGTYIVKVNNGLDEKTTKLVVVRY